MAKVTTKQTDEVITDVLRVEKRTIDAYILGLSPLIFNRPSEKTRHELLLPGGRKTALQKALSLKHDPREEYRASVYHFIDPSTETLLYHLAGAFKGALMTAALDIPGAWKAQIGRLVWVEGDHVPIYGTPQIFMTMVIQAGMSHTPDIRTRAILPKWACKVTISYIEQLIKPQAVSNLLAAGGLTAGIGDYRAQKGKGNYGQFELVAPDDERWLALKREGRVAQELALKNPVSYDDETETLLEWYDEEIVRRTKEGRIQKPKVESEEANA